MYVSNEINSTSEDISLAETIATFTNDFKTHNEAEDICTSNNNNNMNKTNKTENNVTQLKNSQDSLHLLDSSLLRTKNLTFDLLKNQKNKTSNQTLNNADSLFDVTLWVEQFDEPNEVSSHNTLTDFTKDETNWKNPANVNDYEINSDLNPHVIIQKCATSIELLQELCVKYLKPPTPPPAGEVIIKQEKNKLTPPAPPVVIRQLPPRARTPEPLVIREEPPVAPKPHGVKLIKISGSHLPPPPRKVVLERIAPLPSKPQSVILEKWLPYSYIKEKERKLLFPNQVM